MSLNHNSRTFATGFDIFWSGGVFLFSTAWLVILFFQYTAGVITNQTFYLVYVIAGVLSFVLSGAAIFYNVFDRMHNNTVEKGVASTFFISDTTNGRPLSNPLLKLFVFLFLTFAFSIALLIVNSFVSNFEFVPSYNPYSSTPLSETVLDQHGYLINLVNIGVYPGLFEEAPIFFLTNIIVTFIVYGLSFLFRSKELRSNTAVFLFAALIGVTISSAIFMFGHNTAYSLDTTAKLSAFTFEWIVQMANQLTGTYASWIVHIAHNMTVVTITQFSIVAGGSSAIILILWRQPLDLLRTTLSQARLLLIQDWQALRRIAHV